MARHILTIGLAPEAVDFSDPDLPPGLTAAKIHAGLGQARAIAAGRGLDMDNCLLRPDDDIDAAIGRALAAKPYACVVIGGGIRLPRANLPLFERVVNAVHRHGPAVAIAFNTSPPDSVDAACRWLPDPTKNAPA